MVKGERKRAYEASLGQVGFQRLRKTSVGRGGGE